MAELSEGVSAPVTSVSLAAVAAARASASSMMAGLDERVRAETRVCDDARVEEREARQKARVVEKLAERHGLAVSAERARVEQRDADELAGTHGSPPNTAVDTEGSR